MQPLQFSAAARLCCPKGDEGTFPPVTASSLQEAIPRVGGGEAGGRALGPGWGTGVPPPLCSPL